MHSFRFLPVLLALGLVAGCTKSDASNAKKTVGDAAKGAMDAFGGLKDMDFTKMDATKLADTGKSVMGALASQLGGIKDLASATSVVGAIEPMMEKLNGLKTALAGKLPNMDVVTTAISALKTKFGGDNAIMGVLQPLLTKLTSLLS